MRNTSIFDRMTVVPCTVLGKSDFLLPWTAVAAQRRRNEKRFRDARQFHKNCSGILRKMQRKKVRK